MGKREFRISSDDDLQLRVAHNESFQMPRNPLFMIPALVGTEKNLVIVRARTNKVGLYVPDSHKFWNYQGPERTRDVFELVADVSESRQVVLADFTSLELYGPAHRRVFDAYNGHFFGNSSFGGMFGELDISRS